MSSTSVYPTPINAFKQSKRSVLSIIVDNEPGILARIVGLFSGRGYNIEALNVTVVDVKKNISELDDTINEMISIDRPVIADIWVDKKENCFPMIPSGAAHHEMLLSKYDKENPENQEKGKVLV